jgi:DNA-directed RNA polymerase subunit RPC12/RpoP
MGIRFFCPNGHKLNVKEFQAGMRGVCPHCGSKFLIPAQSTRSSSKEKRRLRQAKASRGGTAAFNPSSADRGEAVSPGDPLQAAEPAPIAPPQVQAVAAPDDYPLAVASDGAVAGDPIAQAGNVVWYVRPPSGEQYGPAAGEVLRCWLAEGRISGDTLVWREGWTDWREAQSLFPELRQAGSEVPSLADFSASAVASPAVAPAVKRKIEWNNQKILVAGLAALVVILIILFLVILL